MSDDATRPQHWFAELRRRKVFRVAVVYLVVAWVLIQVAGATFEPMGLPAWTIKLVITLAALGFPLACGLAWAFDVTPRGIERTPPSGPAPDEVLPVAHTASPSPATAQSVAILPFVDLSPAHDQEYFCDGIAEEIINSLCCIRELRIASRTSSFQFKGRSADVREIGKALGVGAVLEGSVRKAGDRVRITAQLVNTTDGYHLWSESFDRDLSDVFAIQSEIAQRLLKALKLTLSKRETQMLERGGTSVSEAYDFYLRGRSYLRYGTSMRPAVGMFRRAIECDERFAQAHAGLANALAIMGMWRLNVSPQEVEEALAASRRALELEPLMPEAYVARACLLSMQGQDAEAARDFDEAIRLNPASYFAYYMYGRHVFAMGRVEQAASLYETADRLQPDDYQVLSMRYGALRKLGRKEQLQEVGERAMRAIERQLEVDPDDGRALQIGAVVAATLHVPERARELADRALLARPNEFGTAYNLACAAAVMGDSDRALELLNQAVRFGQGNLGWIEHDPDLDTLRHDPRFAELVARLTAGPADEDGGG
jgi:TolB-like protein/Flp pilus assembly protein TadD